MPPASSLLCPAGNAWTITSAGVVQLNGANAGFTAGVTGMACVSGVAYQVTPVGCWSWTASKWTQQATCPTIPSGSSSSSSSSGGSASGGSTTLIGFLTSLEGNHTAIGQHIGLWDGNPMAVTNSINTATGQYPAILGTTTGVVGSTENGVADSNAWLAAGGIVQVSWWPPDPLTGSWNDTGPMSAANFASLTTPGTAGYTAWQKLLAAQVAMLKQINGTVIYRPVLEMDGSDSWWKNQNTATFILLWQQMHQYFAANGVTNVLWEWCPNATTAGLNYYPGDSNVDVVGFDLYTSTPGQWLTQNTSVYASLNAHGKPMIVGEAGVENANNSTVAQFSGNNDTDYFQSIRQYAPNVVAIMFFTQNWAIAVQNGMAALMAEVSGVTRAGVPSGLH
jgi:hypothetical protein